MVELEILWLYLTSCQLFESLRSEFSDGHRYEGCHDSAFYAVAFHCIELLYHISSGANVVDYAPFALVSYERCLSLQVPVSQAGASLG